MDGYNTAIYMKFPHNTGLVFKLWPGASWGRLSESKQPNQDILEWILELAVCTSYDKKVSQPPFA